MTYKRILFIGDTHADDNCPASRTDDYLLACVTKLREALNIAKSMKVDAVIHLGDVFHRKEPGPLCRNLILQVLKYDDDGNLWPFPIYVTIGNHDIKHNIQNLPISAIGTLIDSGVVKYVDEIPDLRVGFGHFRNGIEDEILNGFLKTKNHLIWSVHANITKEVFFNEYVRYEDLETDPACKLIVAGHIHFPIECKEDNKPLFINPGSLMRNALNDFNKTRQVNVLFVEYSLNGDYIHTEYIPILSCKPAKEVFNFEAQQHKKDRKQETKQYLKNISNLKLSLQTTDIYTSLRHSGKMKKIDSDIIELAVMAVMDVNESESK